jgi:hypothetical protein
MDERRTLSLLGWIVGSVVGVTFILNAIALSEVPRTAEPPLIYTSAE